MPTPDPSPLDHDVAALALDRPADARSRALRTAVQFFAVSVIVDVVPIAIDALDEADVGADIDAGRLVRAVVRVVLAAVLAYVMRYVTPPPTVT